MPAHLLREIENLKRDILMVGAMAEQSMREAMRAINRRDRVLAMKVIEKDVKIDQAEVEVEENCLKVLALHQPVATDLRFVIAVLKINSDLERVGDLAMNIAECAVFLSARPEVNLDCDLTGMAIKVEDMLKRSLDALVNLDVKVAREVCAFDERIDAIYRQMCCVVQKAVSRNPEGAESMIQLFSASGHLERIAGHATNIAEDVIYMIEGDIIRHRAEGYDVSLSR